MPIGEVCDESHNDRANQDVRERHSSKSMAGTAFMEAAKKAIAKWRICYLQCMDNYIKLRDVVQRMRLVM